MSDKDQLVLAVCSLAKKVRKQIKLLIKSVQLCICWVSYSSFPLQLRAKTG